MAEQESPHHFIDIEQVQILARSLGFSSIGFASISKELMLDHQDGLKAWTEAGHHGDMHYMQTRIEQRGDPSLLLPEAKSVMMVSLDYRPEDPYWRELALARLDTPDQATVSIYAHGRDYHKIVRARLQKLASTLCEQYGAFSYRAFCDSAPVMEIPLALQSGLGWRGKHTLLLNREQGSMFFLGSLYTSLALPDVQVESQDHCGTCTQCISACPTQAITAPYRLDARRCISYLTIEHRGGIPLEFRAAMGNRIYGCDDCQLVCPWNKFAQAPIHAQVRQDLAAREGLDDASLLALWTWNEEEFLKRTEGSAIRRIGYWRWRRNLIIAMGNAVRTLATQKNEAMQATRDLIKDRLSDGLLVANSSQDQILIEHFRWALDPG